MVSKGGDKGAPISSLPSLCRIFHRFVVPPALLTNDPPWYLCCVAKLLENICAESFHCHRFQRPALACNEKNFKMYSWNWASKKIDITFLTSLIGPFGFSAVFSLAFNHTVYNCAYNQNPCHWTIVSSCYSALFKIVSIFLCCFIYHIPQVLTISNSKWAMFSVQYWVLNICYWVLHCVRMGA